MRALVQRVSRASVSVGDEEISGIGPGLLVLVGVEHADEQSSVEKMASKLLGLRIFADADGKMNLSLSQVNGEVLLVSQFTLYGDTRKGNRPSFIRSAAPEVAEPLIQSLAERIGAGGIRVAMGRFGAHMDVDLTNDGPVTLILET